MPVSTRHHPPPHLQLGLLADFRYRLRRFLSFSEASAQSVGLQPQQHQLLLQLAATPADTEPSIGYLAERLGLRHNSAVELCDRCEKGGLLSRTHAALDARRVLLHLTSRGHSLLEALSRDHARELNELGPQLIAALTALQSLPSASTPLQEPK